MFEAICGCIVYALFLIFILIMIADAFKKYNKKDGEKLDKEIDFAIRKMEAKNRKWLNIGMIVWAVNFHVF